MKPPQMESNQITTTKTNSDRKYQKRKQPTLTPKQELVTKTNSDKKYQKRKQPTLTPKQELVRIPRGKSEVIVIKNLRISLRKGKKAC